MYRIMDTPMGPAGRFLREFSDTTVFKFGPLNMMFFTGQVSFSWNKTQMLQFVWLRKTM